MSQLPPVMPPSAYQAQPGGYTGWTLVAGLALLLILTLAAPKQWWVWVPISFVFVALTNHPDVIVAIDNKLRSEGM